MALEPGHTSLIRRRDHIDREWIRATNGARLAVTDPAQATVSQDHN